jgi:hypothetical protein
MTDESLFVDAYSLTTRQKQRIPRAWLDDPILGRDFAKTPAQRELDGELPPRPPGDAKAKEIDAFADAAGVDLTGIKANADKLVAIEQALGTGGDVQDGVVAAEPEPLAADPLAPELVANVELGAVKTSSDTTSPDDTESSDETPAAGDKE